MNIYFSCSITGGRRDQAVYQQIVAYLTARGHSVPTAHLSRADVLDEEKIVDPQEVYSRDVAWVEACDALVAEVSTPSHGVGYEIALALFLGKPVLCCHRQGARVSKMLLGNSQPGLRICAYTDPAGLLAAVEGFLAEIRH